MENADKKSGKQLGTVGELDRMIGARLKFFRLARDFTQTALARDAGITFQQIQKYENGANRVTVSRLIDFARILEFTMSEFFDGICEDAPTMSGLPNDVIEALASPQAVELNRCFAEVRSTHMRRTIVNLVRGIGAVQSGSPQDNGDTF